MTKAESAASRTPIEAATSDHIQEDETVKTLAEVHPAALVRSLAEELLDRRKSVRTLELEAADLREQLSFAERQRDDQIADKHRILDAYEKRLAKAREEAIEECARVCDRFASRNMHPAECAGAIRALAQPKGEDHGNG